VSGEARPPSPDDAPHSFSVVSMTEAAPDPRATARRLDALSVVIPVYNEESWIRRSVAAVTASAEEAGLPLDLVVVDDGSTDRTPEVLRELAAEHGLRVISQANAGRLAARGAGLAQAREDWVLLLDSRVIADRAALSWVRATIAEHPERQVWCGHVDAVTDGNLYAAFWSGLVKIGWRRYMADPRLVSFGADEFDAYPKGTTGLLIPRALLDEAIGAFESMFENENLSSDDTRLLRWVAERTRIWISPDFRFRYHGKEGGRKFLKQSYFRGTTFVDGYLGQPGPVRRVLLGAIGLGAVGAAASLRRPAVAVAGLGAVTALVPAVVARVGGSRDEVRSAALLTPVFAATFGAGVLRGLLLAARGGRRRPGPSAA
jgi:Glycosyl transferase family 2